MHIFLAFLCPSYVHFWFILFNTQPDIFSFTLMWWNLNPESSFFCQDCLMSIANVNMLIDIVYSARYYPQENINHLLAISGTVQQRNNHIFLMNSLLVKIIGPIYAILRKTIGVPCHTKEKYRVLENVTPVNHEWRVNELLLVSHLPVTAIIIIF